MLIDTTQTDASEALAAVTALLPQLDTAALHMLRLRTIPAVMRRRAIETAQKAGCDVEAGLLAVADVTAARAAMIGLAELDDTPGAIVEGGAAERDEDGDPIGEPTPLMDVRPVLVNEIDAE